MVTKEGKVTYEELKQIIQDSGKDDWLYNESKRVFTYKKDLNITIRREYFDDSSFAEDWANGFFKPPSRFMFDIYYGASFVESLYFVALDEHRAEVPLPKSAAELVITPYQYAVVRIADRVDTLDSYMGRAGITVEQ